MRNPRVPCFVAEGELLLLTTVRARVRARGTNGGGWPLKPQGKPPGGSELPPTFGPLGEQAATPDLFFALGAVALATFCALIASLFVPTGDFGQGSMGGLQDVTLQEWRSARARVLDVEVGPRNDVAPGTEAARSEMPAVGRSGSVEAAALTEARRRDALDFEGMKEALGGTLTPELLDLRRRHREASMAFDESLMTYGELDKAHTIAMSEGRVDEDLRERLDAQAHSLKAQSKGIHDLNREITTRFEAAYEASRTAAGR